MTQDTKKQKTPRNRYSIRFFLKQAFTSLWRNGVMTAASIAVLASCLVVLGAFVLLVANLNVNLDNIAKMNVIMVFCEYDLTEEETKDVEKAIKKLPNVEKCVRITKEESLKKMKEESGNAAIYDEMSGENNPLCESFEVTYADVDETKVFDLEARLSDKKNIPGIREIKGVYKTAKTIDNFKNGIMLVFTWFLVILFVVSVFVIINTIKQSVFARRHEITVMRYVGATNSFITIPFVFEGVIIGLLASVIAYGVEFFLYNYVGTTSLGSVSFVTIISTKKIVLPMLAGFAGVGILTGIIGSSASLRKYLKS
ncbi:MAG: permease-like cell division protein FtsX [Clostridia bacterium]|nr:permease-like cell division protein FtsX [Clostridia bacterium]